ncbi:MAG: nucleotidyltransferase domain-containing protein [Bryobacteraceae bacterium]
MALLQRLPVSETELSEFCGRWKIAKLELFGSMLVDPARARDIDLLVTFAKDAKWGLFDHERMQNELAELFGQRVDLTTRRAVELSRNAIRRDAILGSAVPVYVAG